MNAKTMKVVLEHIDDKTTAVVLLKEKIRQYEAIFERWRDILGANNGSCPALEEFIRNMVSERTRLKITEREHADLISALDEVPLTKDDRESAPAYALRVGDAIRSLREDMNTLQKDLHEARLEHGNDQSIIKGLQDHVSIRDGRIARLEDRESELHSLYDTIRSLPGFPTQPQESYAAYLQRLAADNKLNDERATAMDGHLRAIEKAILKADAFRKLPKESFAEYITRLAADRSRLAAALEHLTASTQETTQRLRAQLDGNNQQYAESRAMIANLEAQLAEASKERDNFRARWEESLAERDRGTDEARRTSETNQALQVQLQAVITDTAKQRRADQFESEATLRVALLIIKCLHSCDGLGVIIDATDWNDECQRVIEMARIADDRDDLLLEVDFADQWGSRISDPLKRAARMATEHTELTNRISSVSRLEGELSLHLQIIARMMMQPTIALMVNELEWNGSAQQVLKAARGMVSDEGNVQS
jgi:DNA repair exonuclease SbcCD ATPase subunit